MLERYRILLPFCAVQTLCPKTREPEAGAGETRTRTVHRLPLRFKRCILLRREIFLHAPITLFTCYSSTRVGRLSASLDPPQVALLTGVVSRNVTVATPRRCGKASFSTIPRTIPATIRSREARTMSLSVLICHDEGNRVSDAILPSGDASRRLCASRHALKSSAIRIIPISRLFLAYFSRETLLAARNTPWAIKKTINRLTRRGSRRT